MEENLRDSSMMSGSDYEHLKAWQNKPDLDYYLSDEHWNYRVNLLIYDYLKNRYEGNEVGVFINLGLNSSEAFKIDYEKGCYGVMFNEAYYFCSFVLTTPVPQTKITFLEGEAETLCHVELAKPIIAYHILVMTGFILCLSNVQNDAVGRFLKTLSSYNHTHYFGFEFQHFENYIKIGLNCVAAIMRDGLLQPPGKLQPEYDYMGRDRYLRNTIPWYRIYAEAIDKELGNDIFHENLDPDKIARAIIEIDRGDMAERHFVKVLHETFKSLKPCLVITSVPKFLEWMKANCGFKLKTPYLKDVKLNKDEKKKIEEYRAIFAVKQKDGSWRFNRRFYKKNKQGDYLQSIEKRG